MDRRNFFRMLGGAAAVAAVPSEVWPFRKIFLPFWPPRNFFRIWDPAVPTTVSSNALASYPECVNVSGFAHESINGLYRVNENAVYALELETFRKEIPALIMQADDFWKLIKRNDVVEFDSHPFFPRPRVMSFPAHEEEHGPVIDIDLP